MANNAFLIDVYSDALLSAHEAEISRLQTLVNQRRPILTLIARHESILADRADLEASSQDASRLTTRGQKGERRDPGKLLREEKMRKRIAKELPKLEKELHNLLEEWEHEYGRDFLVRGERYLDELTPTTGASHNSTMIAPPRSKTPAPTSTTLPVRPATVHKSSQSMGNNTIRVQPRSKTPTPFGNSSRSNTMSTSTALSTSTIRGHTRSKTAHDAMRSMKINNGAATISPSKIPARPPLSAMRDGANAQTVSPSRIAKLTGGTIAPGTMRGPPPKMKDLFVPPPNNSRPGMPTFTKPNDGFDSRNGSSSSIVRHVPPEDVYEDRSMNMQAQQQQQRMKMRSQQQHHHHHQQQQQQQQQPGWASQSIVMTPNMSMTGPSSSNAYSRPESAFSARSLASSTVWSDYPMAPPAPSTNGGGSSAPSISSGASTRQISGSSAGTAASAVSGSENWETFDDASSDEAPDPRMGPYKHYYHHHTLSAPQQNRSQCRIPGSPGERAFDSDLKRSRDAPAYRSQYGGTPAEKVGKIRTVGLGMRGAGIANSTAGEWTDDDGF